MRKLLLAVLLVSLAGSAFGAGTFASFTASVTNANSTFATGSLVLSTTPSASGTGSPTATACFSTAGGVNSGVTDSNNFANCGAFLTTAVGLPSSDGTNATDSAFGVVAIKNEGTLTGNTLSYAVACGSTTTNAATTFHGTVSSTSLCNTTAVGTSPSNNLQIRIQEVTDATGATPAVSKCVLPASNTQNCATAAAWTPLGTANTNGTVALTATNSSGATLAAGATRYFKFSLLLPSTANNAVQGLSQPFSVTWSVTQ